MKCLKVFLGQAFASIDQTDWESRVLLFRPLGFGVLLRYGLLEATADVSLCFAWQARLLLAVWTESATRV